MNIQAVLQERKKIFDVELARYFDEIIDEARDKDAFTVEMLEYVKTFALSGGKRLRPTLMYFGYLAAGGKNPEKMHRLALSIELIHIFLLIHDDIIDRDDMRHGVPTVHTRFSQMGRALLGIDDPKHFGDSMAIIVGDMVHALGNRLLFESDFDSKLVFRALSRLQSIIAMTVVGQVKDVHIEYAHTTSEEEILRMYEYKTARYTMEGPLHLGAIMAGADDTFLERLSLYAVPIGIAFQIQDDILGIFGSEKKLGKPVGSDIIEGKRTILVSRTLANLASGDAREFESLLAKGSAITTKDIARFREFVESTGALESVRALAREYISKGREVMLEWDGINDEAKEFLVGVADYMLQRET